MENENKNQNKFSLPLAIAFVGILIAGAIVYNKTEIKVVDNSDRAGSAQNEADSLKKVRKVSASRDYIRGNQNAEIFIIEYSDTECPFCKQFHSTMKQIFNEYGNGGRVAWVYRHFPLEQLHKKARQEALALECVGELGGTEKFWQYTDKIYEITPSNDGLDLAELPKIASSINLDVKAFNECLNSGRHNSRVNEDLQNAIEIGGRGTPWSIIITKEGDVYPLSGAQPYEVIKNLIDNLLKK